MTDFPPRLFYHTVGRYGENDQCRLLDENSSEAPGCYIKDDTGQLAFAECAPIPVSQSISQL